MSVDVVKACYGAVKSLPCAVRWPPGCYCPERHRLALSRGTFVSLAGLPPEAMNGALLLGYEVAVDDELPFGYIVPRQESRA